MFGKRSDSWSFSPGTNGRRVTTWSPISSSGVGSSKPPGRSCSGDRMPLSVGLAPEGATTTSTGALRCPTPIRSPLPPRLLPMLSVDHRHHVVDVGPDPLPFAAACRVLDVLLRADPSHHLRQLLEAMGLPAEFETTAQALDELGDVGAGGTVLLDGIQRIAEPQRFLSLLSRWALTHGEPALLIPPMSPISIAAYACSAASGVDRTGPHGRRRPAPVHRGDPATPDRAVRLDRAGGP